MERSLRGPAMTALSGGRLMMGTERLAVALALVLSGGWWLACAGARPAPAPVERPRQEAAAPAPAAEPAPDLGAADAARLRVMAANVSSGNLQSYPDPGPGTRIFQALQPDVVLIQEFNVNATGGAANDSAALEAWVDSVFGTDYHAFREPGGDSIPNGVISRWPIVESGEWNDPEVGNRDFAFARIDIPGEVDLWAVSVHLLTRGPGARSAEARALVEAMRAHPVPEGDYVVVGGDFNTDHRNEPALSILAEVVDTLGPFPHDGADPPDGDTNSGRRKPYDWVLADADLEALAVPVTVGDFQFPDGLVFDSRVFSQDDLDESFPPVRRDDSDAPQMQHMAVVRDFLLSGGAVDYTLSASEIDFGTADASSPARLEGSVEIRPARPVTLLAVELAGSHPREFALVAPDLGAGPVTVTGPAELVFAWRPAANDGAAREVAVTIATDAVPESAVVTLRGRTARPAAGGALALGGWRIEQTGGAAALTIPAGVELAPGGILVVGRAADREEFEAFWGALGPGVVYLDGRQIAGEPGFPVINGDERYRLLDAAGEPVDPAAGTLPPIPTPRGHAYARAATDADAFTPLPDPLRDATPGRFAGVAAGTGRAVLTELSDAPGGGSFRFEFIEIFFDAP